MSFFRDPSVGELIGGYILDRKPIGQAQVQAALATHFASEPITVILMKQRGLDAAQIIPDFLTCYRRVLSEQLSLPEMAILLEVVEQSEGVLAEIQVSETRMKDYIRQLLESKLSPEALAAAYQENQQAIATDLAQEMSAVGLLQVDQAERTISARLNPLPALFAQGLCRGRPLHPAPDQYFVSHGFDTDTLADWRQTLSQTLVHAGGAQKPLVPYFVGDSLLGGFRLCGISEKLCATRFCVFLLPASQDRNVYLELGIAIGLGAPLLLIQHFEAKIPAVLEGLSRYTKGGLFRTMRRELAGQIEEYDFGVVRFPAAQPEPVTKRGYLIAAGETIEDEDFEASICDALGMYYPNLEAISERERVGESFSSGWMLGQLVEAIQGARFSVYRVDEACSATTFLALGISIGLIDRFSWFGEPTEKCH